MFELIVSAAAAAAAQAPLSANEAAACLASESGANANKGLLLYLQVDDAPRMVSAPPVSKAAAYTRIRADFVPCGRTADRAYDRERRHWFRRYFAHKVVGKVLKVTASVKPIGVSSSNTLTSIGRDSGKSGEVWTTRIENDTILLPYFRSSPHGVVNLDVTFSSTRDYNTSISADAIDVVKRAATLISPTATLVTSINKPRFNEAATFVDSTIDGLLKIAINEDAHIAAPLAGGSEEQDLASLTLYAAGANDPFQGGVVPIGRWIIRAEPLDGSIFALRDNAGVLSNDLSAASIMNFQVGDERSLKDALNSSEAVHQAHDSLLGADDDDAVVDAATTLCRAVAVEADSLGFSPEDVGHAVWAYLADSALPASKSAAYGACEALDHYPDSQKRPPEALVE